MASTPLPFRGQTASGLKPPLHPAPGASGEFGSHAIRPRSSHHMQVMTVFRPTPPKTSSRRRPGSSVFTEFTNIQLFNYSPLRFTIKFSNRFSTLTPTHPARPQPLQRYRWRRSAVDNPVPDQPYQLGFAATLSAPRHRVVQNHAHA